MTLEQAVLTALHNVDGCMLREQPLHIDVCAMMPHGKAPTLTTMRSALAALEARHQVVGVQDDEGRTLWKVTAAGRARLAEMGL